MATEISVLEETKASLVRLQDFGVEDLAQSSRLGASAFDLAIAPARKIVELFKLLPVGALDQFPDRELGLIKSLTDQIFNIFQEILSFDSDAGSNKTRQQALVEQLESQYQQVFTQFYPLVAFSTARTVDFNKLDNQGRAAVQSIRDQAKAIVDELSTNQADINRILDEVRKVAAEQGVSQQATYFKEEADKHSLETLYWRRWTIIMAIVVGAYSVAAMILHKWSWIAPTDNFQLIQFTTSKLLLFFVMTYMLFLCSRNFLSNRHNEIVNRHRQNSLLTYKALVDAGSTPESRDIILNHAASSIYRLHETGYAKSGESAGSSSSSIVEMIPRASMPINL